MEKKEYLGIIGNRSNEESLIGNINIYHPNLLEEEIFIDDGWNL